MPLEDLDQDLKLLRGVLKPFFDSGRVLPFVVCIAAWVEHGFAKVNVEVLRREEG
jgi:hypothetical protein